MPRCTGAADASSLAFACFQRTLEYTFTAVVACIVDEKPAHVQGGKPSVRGGRDGRVESTAIKIDCSQGLAVDLAFPQGGRHPKRAQ